MSSMKYEFSWQANHPKRHPKLNPLSCENFGCVMRYIDDTVILRRHSIQHTTPRCNSSMLNGNLQRKKNNISIKFKLDSTSCIWFFWDLKFVKYRHSYLLRDKLDAIVPISIVEAISANTVMIIRKTAATASAFIWNISMGNK